MAIANVSRQVAVQEVARSKGRPQAASGHGDRPTMPGDRLALGSARMGKGLRQGLITALVATPAAAIGADSVLGGTTRAMKQLTLGAAVLSTASAAVVGRVLAARGLGRGERALGCLMTGAAVGGVTGVLSGQAARGLVTGLAGGTLAILTAMTLYHE